MKVQLISDIHVEFHADRGASFLRSLDSTGVDLLVVAGDLGMLKDLDLAFSVLCDKYPAIAYVLGNHELYKASPKAAESKMLDICHRYANLHWLNENIVEVNGQRFVGTSLWFPSDAGAEKDRDEMNDFLLINDFENWVFEKNARAQEFLKNNVRKGDVVVTHHLPSWKCVATQFSGSALNKYFVCDMEPVIVTQQPKFWFFGHTHEQTKVEIGRCQLISNPFGYLWTETDANERFCERLVLDI